MIRLTSLALFWLLFGFLSPAVLATESGTYGASGGMTASISLSNDAFPDADLGKVVMGSVDFVQSDFFATDSSDLRSVERAILTLFDGMRKADTTMIHSVIHDEMTLSTVVTLPDGRIKLRTSPTSSFLQAVSASGNPVWDERISDLNIQIDGGLATAWMTYHFYRGTEFSHCGVNTMNLIKSEENWLIFSIADTRRREGC